jgi:hypothetical protein
MDTFLVLGLALLMKDQGYIVNRKI